MSRLKRIEDNKDKGKSNKSSNKRIRQFTFNVTCCMNDSQLRMLDTIGSHLRSPSRAHTIRLLVADRYVEVIVPEIENRREDQEYTPDAESSSTNREV